ncbi:MAG: hypothetical protein MK105_01635 [Crocinitomicaceae bacterium]|nr:hypothetical protein [Crocinitomicaceae bacterium]
MREELLSPKVENIGVAIVKQLNEEKETIYNVYLLNLSDFIIDEILITSRGYGIDHNTGDKIKTSVLRHKVDLLMPNEVAKIEPIMEDVFGIANEYWVSFYRDDKMYDKKYVFVPGSLAEENMMVIPVLGDKGVMII